MEATQEAETEGNQPQLDQGLETVADAAHQAVSFLQKLRHALLDGGITEEGTKVVYEGFPETADLLFEKTLEKRRLTTEIAEKSF